ncbi:MAG: hypothetical protein CVV27_02210 [Candidatus Melainabacteria bacterium HGW-Melainabacteria-1]|nr:MAG: hypothetical protein CVV27_02210 [Candidatus Melainabacteria bacterium HGW-Melainabacteria-1]
MYVEPLEFVDESLAGKAPARPLKSEKKKAGGGLLASLFGSKAAEPEVDERPAAAPAKASLAVSGQLPEGVARDQIQIRCQECKHLTGLDAHSGYCDNCGAFYVEPLEYVTPASLAAEREALQADLEKYRKVVKTFEEMNDTEKLAHLKEKVADTWDQIAKDRHVLNEKANECMQCFTAAGTIKSEDQYEVLASTIKQRYHNLKDFEIFHREYQQLLDQFNSLHQELLTARQAYSEQHHKVQAQAPTT